MIVWGGSNNSHDDYNLPTVITGGRYFLDRSPDDDRDGFSICAGDCDDAAGAVHPGAAESCNDLDDDCNGQIDEIPPIIACRPEVVMECPVRQVDLERPGTLPGCDPSLAVSNDAPDELRLGSTMVGWTVAGSHGRTSSCQQPVGVVDTTAPLISFAATPPTLWPPNHRMVDVTTSVTATDACSVPGLALASISSSEPDDAGGDGDGNTIGDIAGAEVGTADFALQLRAERDGSGGGRVYTLTYTAIDGSGNGASVTGFVVVPHDQGQGAEPLILSVSESDAGTILSWSDVPGAVSYDVVRGDLRKVHETESAIDLGAVICIEANFTVSTTIGHEDPAMPASGEAFFYLVDYSDGRDRSGYGTVDISKPAMVTSGDCR